MRPKRSGALAVDDEEIIRFTREVGAAEGLFVAPEGAACFAALKSLLDLGKITRAERIVIFNTGSGISIWGATTVEGIRLTPGRAPFSIARGSHVQNGECGF